MSLRSQMCAPRAQVVTSVARGALGAGRLVILGLVSLLFLTGAPVEARVHSAAQTAPPPLRLASIFGDHMVLQRGQNVRVWGHASPGAAVKVRLGRERATAFAGHDGGWDVRLGAFEASSDGKTLVATCGDERVEVRNVAIGDVWLCSGQSNMAFELGRARSFDELGGDIALWDVRLFDRRASVSMAGRPFPADLLESLSAQTLYRRSTWRPSDAASAAGFSAVAWFFGAAVHRELDVPIGLIHCAIGGSPIEAWLPRDALADDAALRGLLEDWLHNPEYPRWVQGRARTNLAPWLGAPTERIPHHPYEPSILFDAAVQPITRMPIRGVLWYQGESNATEDGGQGLPVGPGINAHKMRLLVQSWRAAWEAPQLPFLMVQLPGLNREWPPFREAQARVAHADEHVHLAVTLDVGHPTDVHPRAKRPVGERLARLALAHLHGQAVVPAGPDLIGAPAAGDGTLLVRLSQAGGLRTVDELPPRCFAVAGADQRFHPAEAVIVGESVRVSSPDVPHPVAVRYGWENDPPVNLVNRAGLPAAPFRSDDWDLRPKIRVACIGDSITFGSTIEDRSRQSYPARLARRLGPDYDVRNFGRPGAGVVQRSMRGNEKRAFVFSREHRFALDWEPDLVVSNLGINDVMDWERFGTSDFVRDYVDLIQRYRALPTDPEVLLWTPLTPLFSGQPFFGDPNVAAIHRAIRHAAAQGSVSTVDAGEWLAGRPDLAPDHIHPSADGAAAIAEGVAGEIRRLGLGRE